MSDHEWCKDVFRDEAVRRAEDAAAVPSLQHRDLPAAVEALTRRVEGLEEFAGRARARTVSRSGTVESVTVVHPVPQPAPVPPADGLRTERVTLEVTHACDYSVSQWILPMVRDDLTPRESVRVVEECCLDRINMGELIRQRDAAIRERDEARAECERLRHLLNTKERECETHHPWVHPSSAAPAANAGGQPVAWGVLNELGKRIAVIDEEPSDGWVGCTFVPIYAAPQPPRGWLTEEERDAVDFARAYYHAQTCGMDEAGAWHKLHRRRQLACEALLARSTPPKVRRPNPNVVITTVDARERIDRQWIAAIREAGGEVGE